MAVLNTAPMILPPTHGSGELDNGIPPFTHGSGELDTGAVWEQGTGEAWEQDTAAGVVLTGLASI